MPNIHNLSTRRRNVVVLLLTTIGAAVVVDSFSITNQIIQKSSTVKRKPSRRSFASISLRETKSGSDIIGGDDDEYPKQEGEEEEEDIIHGVTLKMAFDLQGGVADLSNEKSERFTSPQSLDMVHRLRCVSDAVLVGRSTVEIDDCTLTVRRVVLPFNRTQPIRIIIDPDQKLQLDQYQIAKDGLAYHCRISIGR